MQARSLLAALLLFASVALATPASAQDDPRAADAELRSYAAAVIQIEAIRDEIGTRMARPENKTVERQAELRKELNDKVAAAIKSHGLTQQLYDRLEYLVTTNQEWRSAFERRLSTARGSGRPAPP
jgi:hypothetical protein